MNEHRESGKYVYQYFKVTLNFTYKVILFMKEHSDTTHCKKVRDCIRGAEQYNVGKIKQLIMFKSIYFTKNTFLP